MGEKASHSRPTQYMLETFQKNGEKTPEFKIIQSAFLKYAAFAEASLILLHYEEKEKSMESLSYLFINSDLRPVIPFSYYLYSVHTQPASIYCSSLTFLLN
jgi:hypothetical protein